MPTKANKFEKLDRDQLFRLVLEQEDELERLRPKPPKFKLGQLVAQPGKHPLWQGQPGTYWIVLSVEEKNGKWHYGYAKAGSAATAPFHTFPEDKLRAVTQAELTGTDLPMPALAPAEPTIHVGHVPPGQALNAQVQAQNAPDVMYFGLDEVGQP